MPTLRIHMLMWLKKITKSECTLVHKRTHARTQRWFCLPFYFTWINVKFLTIFVAWVVFRGCQLLSFFWIHLLVLVNGNALHFVYLPLAHTKTNEHRTTYAWINKINAKKASQTQRNILKHENTFNHGILFTCTQTQRSTAHIHASQSLAGFLICINFMCLATCC